MSERTSTPTSALIVASAMSRFDLAYLESRSLASWRAAFDEAAVAFDRPAASLKMLRDEFDAHYPNSRQGWSKAEMRPPIRRTVSEMEPLTMDLHLELADCALTGRMAELAPVTAVIEPAQDASAVAQRLRTGRLAEEWFMQNAPSLFPPASRGLIDCRLSAGGFDFTCLADTNVFIEVKGIVGESGPLLFTEREWATALERESQYWLAVVSNVYTSPQLRAVPNPANVLTGVRFERMTITPEWRVTFQANRYTRYI